MADLNEIKKRLEEYWPETNNEAMWYDLYWALSPEDVRFLLKQAEMSEEAIELIKDGNDDMAYRGINRYKEFLEKWGIKDE